MMSLGTDAGPESLPPFTNGRIKDCLLHVIICNIQYNWHGNIQYNYIHIHMEMKQKSNFQFF